MLFRSGKPSKWQCASYKKCKLKKNKKYITFKKSKAKAPKPSPSLPPISEPTPPPTALPALPSKYVSMQPLPYVDLNTAKSGASVGRCTQMNAYLHTKQQPPLTADNEPSTCESESAPCCRFFNRCDNHGVVDNQHNNGWCANGDKNYRIPGESVTITRKVIGEPLKSRHLASVIAAGAGEDVPWPDFVAHAVGLQYCAAKSLAQVDDAFWSWLEARPELLLTLAATAYPVQAKIWENLQRFWQESEFRAAAESNPEFASHMVGFAYMQRKTSVDGHPLQLHWATAHGDSAVATGHSGKFADGCDATSLPCCEALGSEGCREGVCDVVGTNAPSHVYHAQGGNHDNPKEALRIRCLIAAHHRLGRVRQETAHAVEFHCVKDGEQ